MPEVNPEEWGEWHRGVYYSYRLSKERPSAAGPDRFVCSVEIQDKHGKIAKRVGSIQVWSLPEFGLHNIRTVWVKFYGEVEDVETLLRWGGPPLSELPPGGTLGPGMHPIKD